MRTSGSGEHFKANNEITEEQRKLHEQLDNFLQLTDFITINGSK